MKRFRVIGGVFLALAGLVFALPYIVSAERFRPLIQSQLQSALGRPVEFGELNLRIIPLALRATNLKIEGLATVDTIDVHARILPLLQGNVEVDSLTLTRPVVTYKSNPNSSKNSEIPTLNSLRIIDGRLITGGSEYANIDADLSLGNQTSGTISWENGTLPVKLAFAAVNNNGLWNFSRLDAVMGKVTAAFTGTVDTNSSTVNGGLQIKPSPLAGLPVKSEYKPSGTVTADVKVSGPYKEPALSGTAQIANLEVTGGKLSQPLRASALHLDLTPESIAAKPFSLQVGPTLVQAVFRLKNYKIIDADISTKDASIRDLLAIAQTNTVTGTGTATLNVHAAGSVDKPQLSGSGSLSNADLHLPALNPNLKIDSAQIKFEAGSATLDNAVFHIGKSNWQGSIKAHNFTHPQLAVSLKADQLSHTDIQSWLPPSKGGDSAPVTITGDITIGKFLLNDLALDNAKASLTFRDKVLTLDPLSASVYGGRLAGSAIVNLKAQPAVFQLNTHLDKIESEQLLAATTPLRKIVSGPLTADAQLQFSPKPGEDFARTLDGAINFQLTPGKLIPVNLLGELGAIAKFLKPLNAAGSATSFLGMKGQFQIKNGAAETKDLRLELDRAAALFTGSVNLVDQSLNLRMMTTLNKEFSDEVGGTKIGGFLSAALASPKGELLIPSLVRGTLSKPLFAPDPVTLAKMKLNQGSNIQENVQGILDLFKGKKKQP
ncbi:MAG: AsmA family protein [Acidobacteria bacterium]|nr:AsmA family protein [Acidobacteriota bacterium]